VLIQMTQKINLKISSNHGGITLEDITIEQVVILTQTIVGVKGPHKITISWEDDGIDEPVEESIPEPEPGQELESSLFGDDPDEVTTSLTRTTAVIPEPPGPVDDLPQHKDPVIFNEMDRISKTKLAKYIDIDVFNMGYHNQGEGKIVICYGTTKVYTSWEDMFKLPRFIDNESIKKLNNLKQVAIRHFRKWMAVHPDLLPDGVDPDAEFRSVGVGQSVYPPVRPTGQDFGKGN